MRWILGTLCCFVLWHCQPQVEALAEGLPAITVPALPEPVPAKPVIDLRGRTGESYDYAYEGGKGSKPLRWHGRAFLSPRTQVAAQVADEPLPLVIFLHGLNAALIRHRWMGGGKEGDVRRIVGELIEQQQMAPAVVAGPGSVVRSQVARGASWRGFDLDNFIDRTIQRLEGVARIDESRILVSGHSGAGCSPNGGLATVSQSRRKLHAIVVLDTCLQPWLGETLAQTAPGTHLIVSYQKISWASRSFGGFLGALRKGVEAHPAQPGIFRETQQLKPRKAPHDQVVPLTLREWLPKLLPIHR